MFFCLLVSFSLCEKVGDSTVTLSVSYLNSENARLRPQIADHLDATRGEERMRPL